MGGRYPCFMVGRHVRHRLICGLAASAVAALSQSTNVLADDVPHVGATQCDRLGAYPYDDRRVSDPVERVADLDAAIGACREALVKHPGHPRLLLNLGALIHKKKRPRWAPSPAIPFLRQSSAQGYLAAKYLLGEVLVRSWGHNRRREGFHVMLEAARAGHVEAQAQVSYYVGRGEKAERAEALRWGEKAIEKGHHGALAAVATAYLMVLSDKKNYPKAVAYLRKGDRVGSLDAMALLGRLQVFPFAPNGLRDLLPENPYGGMERMHYAAARGSQKAAFYLGLAYAGSTINVSANKDKMIKWFCRAGDRGRYMVAEMLEQDVAVYECPAKYKLPPLTR
jgi:TPR repeat protein